jgi:uncharacterized protein
MGAGHCATMCGPITLALVSRNASRPKQPFAVHVGRIGTYAALGALVATLSFAATNFLRNEFLQTAWLLLPNLLLMLSALYLMGFHQAYAPIENAGNYVWRNLGGARRWAAANTGMRGDLARGAVWGMMPCAMIYSALGLAVLAATPVGGALVMMAFGASTLPVLLALGVLSQNAVKRIQSVAARRLLGAVLLALVAWNVYLLPDRLSGVRFSFFC